MTVVDCNLIEQRILRKIQLQKMFAGSKRLHYSLPYNNSNFQLQITKLFPLHEEYEGSCENAYTSKDASRIVIVVCI